MIIVGLTGGIGSGKTTVAKLFHKLGVPVYIADLEAKKLMIKSKIIKRKLIALFGNQAYLNETLNKSYLSDKIYNDTSLLSKMNAIVHPKVAAHFSRWVKKQKSEYVIKEAAILFENDNYKFCDYIIIVSASEDERINRVMSRDNVTRNKVLTIIKNQWNDARKIALSNFVIKNNSLEDIKSQVEIIHKKILSSTQ